MILSCQISSTRRGKICKKLQIMSDRFWAHIICHSFQRLREDLPKGTRAKLPKYIHLREIQSLTMSSSDFSASSNLMEPIGLSQTHLKGWAKFDFFNEVTNVSGQNQSGWITDQRFGQALVPGLIPEQRFSLSRILLFYDQFLFQGPSFGLELGGKRKEMCFLLFSMSLVQFPDTGTTDAGCEIIAKAPPKIETKITWITSTSVLKR